MEDHDLAAARGLTVDALRAHLKDALGRIEDGFRAACIYVTALRERGEALPVLPAAFSFAADVAEGVLSPHAVMALADRPGALRQMRVLPHEWQDRLADGEEIAVAMRSDAGRISSRKMTVADRDMTEAIMRLAFSEDGITPLEEQQAFLHRQGNVIPMRPKSAFRLRIEDDGETLKASRATFTMDELKRALAAEGLMIKPIYGQRRSAK